MKLGIVTPLEYVDPINQVLNQDFKEIEAKLYIYKDFTEIPELLRDQQKHLDALLFGSESLLAYAYKYLKPLIYWECIPRANTTLLHALFKILLTENKSVYHISYDCGDGMKQLTDLYEDFALAKERLHIVPFTMDTRDFNYADSIYTFHEQLFLNKQVSYCITGYNSIYKKLKENDIPAFLLVKNIDCIRNAIDKVNNNYKIEVRQQSQNVAIHIRIDSPGEYSFLNDDEYHYIIDKANIAREIYLYALRLKAAVIEINSNEFILFSNSDTVKSVTNNFEKIDLLNLVREKALGTVSIGIGFGKTAQEAKSNSLVGLERAVKIGKNTAFVILDKNKTIGPLRTIEDKKKDISDSVDKKILNLAEITGISTNTLHRLQSIIKQQGKTQFTSYELANLLGVSQRTMNKLILKLQDNRICYETGKRMLTMTGRPRRILEIILP